MKARKIISLLLALTMVLALGAVVAFAAPEKEPTALEDAKIIKNFAVADGVNINNDKTFTFSFTAGSSDTAATADHPVIANKTITVGDQSDDLATGELALSEVFSVGDFKHAGEYVYTVKEVAGSNEKITYDSTEYTLRVFVVNGTDGLEIKGVTVEKAGDKVDPTGDNNGFKFENKYKEDLDNENGVLTVKKEVTGNYGDKTKKFPVTVTIEIPTTAKKEDVAVKAGTINGEGTTLTVTADLADSDSIVFTKLPAGTTFKVEETQDTLYKGKISGDLVETKEFGAGEKVEAESTGPIVDNTAKTVTLTNSRDDVIPTGVIINNLPYILLVLVAGAGIAYLTLKKRNNNA